MRRGSRKKKASSNWSLFQNFSQGLFDDTNDNNNETIKSNHKTLSAVDLLNKIDQLDPSSEKGENEFFAFIAKYIEALSLRFKTKLSSDKSLKPEIILFDVYHLYSPQRFEKVEYVGVEDLRKKLQVLLNKIICDIDIDKIEYSYHYDDCAEKIIKFLDKQEPKGSERLTAKEKRLKKQCEVTRRIIQDIKKLPVKMGKYVGIEKSCEKIQIFLNRIAYDIDMDKIHNVSYYSGASEAMLAFLDKQEPKWDDQLTNKTQELQNQYKTAREIINKIKTLPDNRLSQKLFKFLRREPKWDQLIEDTIKLSDEHEKLKQRYKQVRCIAEGLQLYEQLLIFFETLVVLPSVIQKSWPDFFKQLFDSMTKIAKNDDQWSDIIRLRAARILLMLHKITITSAESFIREYVIPSLLPKPPKCELHIMHSKMPSSDLKNKVIQLKAYTVSIRYNNYYLGFCNNKGSFEERILDEKCVVTKDILHYHYKECVIDNQELSEKIACQIELYHGRTEQLKPLKDFYTKVLRGDINQLEENQLKDFRDTILKKFNATLAQLSNNDLRNQYDVVVNQLKLSDSEGLKLLEDSCKLVKISWSVDVSELVFEKISISTAVHSLRQLQLNDVPAVECLIDQAAWLNYRLISIFESCGIKQIANNRNSFYLFGSLFAGVNQKDGQKIAQVFNITDVFPPDESQAAKGRFYSSEKSSYSKFTVPLSSTYLVAKNISSIVFELEKPIKKIIKNIQGEIFGYDVSHRDAKILLKTLFFQDILVEPYLLNFLDPYFIDNFELKFLSRFEDNNKKPTLFEQEIISGFANFKELIDKLKHHCLLVIRKDVRANIGNRQFVICFLSLPYIFRNLNFEEKKRLVIAASELLKDIVDGIKKRLPELNLDNNDIFSSSKWVTIIEVIEEAFQVLTQTEEIFIDFFENIFPNHKLCQPTLGLTGEQNEKLKDRVEKLYNSLKLTEGQKKELESRLKGTYSTFKDFLNLMSSLNSIIEYWQSFVIFYKEYVTPLVNYLKRVQSKLKRQINSKLEDKELVIKSYYDNFVELEKSKPEDQKSFQRKLILTIAQGFVNNVKGLTSTEKLKLVIFLRQYMNEKYPKAKVVPKKVPSNDNSNLQYVEIDFSKPEDVEKLLFQRNKQNEKEEDTPKNDSSFQTDYFEEDDSEENSEEMVEIDFSNPEKAFEALFGQQNNEQEGEEQSEENNQPTGFGLDS